MFVARESKIHLDAKNTLCEMFNSLGDGFQALVELPLMKYNYNKDNTWTGMMWGKQSQVPDFETCRRHYGDYRFGPFAIVDVAVYQYCRLKYIIEICATNPVSNDKLNKIKQEGLTVFEVNAQDVLALDTKNPESLRKIMKKLC